MPRRLHSGDPALADVLALLRDAFAYMDGRIDPPSSLHRLGLRELTSLATSAEIWFIGAPSQSCVILTARPPVFYLGKLAVAAPARGKGHARRLVGLAQDRAVSLGLSWLELETRVELTENQETFAALGFVEKGRTAHDGFDRPTSVTMRRAVH